MNKLLIAAALAAVAQCMVKFNRPQVAYYTKTVPIVDNILGLNLFTRYDVDFGYTTQYDGNSGQTYFQQGYGIDFYSYFNITYVAATPIYYYSITFSVIPYDVVPFALDLIIGQQGGSQSDLPAFGLYAKGLYSMRFLSIDTRFSQNVVIVGQSIYEIVKDQMSSKPKELTADTFFTTRYDNRFKAQIKSEFLSFDFFKLILQNKAPWYNGAGPEKVYFNQNLF